MIETETRAQSLPEFNELDGISPNFINQARELHRIIAEPIDGNFTYESFLPEVVGYVPEEERQLFDELSVGRDRNYRGWSPGKGGDMGRAGLRVTFPGIYEVVTRDLERLGKSEDPTKAILAEFERAEAAALSTPRLPGLHIDSLIVDKNENTEPVFYLIANQAATEYYEGQAPITKYTGLNSTSLGFEEADPTSNDFASGGHIIQGPDYGIVRLHGLTIHRSPQVHEDTIRTFCRIKLIPKSVAESRLSQ